MKRVIVYYAPSAGENSCQLPEKGQMDIGKYRQETHTKRQKFNSKYTRKKGMK